MAETPAVQRLETYLRTQAIHLAVLPEVARLHNLSWREISITFTGKTTGDSTGEAFNVPVFDEFNDVALHNPVIWFHLVLQTCEYFEDADSFEPWLVDNGLKHNALSELLYVEIKQLVPQLRQYLAGAPPAINDHDIEFNTFTAQDLRACEPKQ